MNRRDVLTGAIGLAGAAATGRALAQTATPVGETGVPMSQGALPLGPLSPHYPDPAVQGMDRRFPGPPGNASVERVASGLRWAEGPAYFPAGRYLVFSDAPNNRIMRLTEDDG